MREVHVHNRINDVNIFCSSQNIWEQIVISFRFHLNLFSELCWGFFPMCKLIRDIQKVLYVKGGMW